MFGRNGKSSGFTLIELLVVVIIVAVLAAVGIPLLTGNVERARLSEAEAALGTVRTAMRAEFAETGALVGYSNIPPGAVVDAAIGLNAGDLTGRFFDDDDFQIVAVDIATFCVGATGGANADVAVANAQVAGLTRSMNQDGTIFDDAACAGNQLN